MEPRFQKILLPLAAALSFLLGFITARTLDTKTRPQVQLGAAAGRAAPTVAPTYAPSEAARQETPRSAEEAGRAATPRPSPFVASPSPPAPTATQSPQAWPSPWPVPSPSAPPSVQQQAPQTGAAAPTQAAENAAQIQNSIQILQTELSGINQQLDQSLKAQELEIAQQNAVFNDTLTTLREQIRIQQGAVADAARWMQMTVTDAESEQMIALQNQLNTQRRRLDYLLQQYANVQNQRSAALQSLQQARDNMSAQAQTQRAAIQSRLAELQSASAIQGS